MVVITRPGCRLTLVSVVVSCWSVTIAIWVVLIVAPGFSAVAISSVIAAAAIVVTGIHLAIVMRGVQSFFVVRSHIEGGLVRIVAVVAMGSDLLFVVAGQTAFSLVVDESEYAQE
jgi:hypothetical protein